MQGMKVSFILRYLLISIDTIAFEKSWFKQGHAKGESF